MTGVISAGDVTSVSGPDPAAPPSEFRLAQNYPNPFNPSTTIRFALPRESEVTLGIYDLLGREIATLVNETLPAGEYEFTFEANGLPSGVYVYRMHTNHGFEQTRRLTLLK